MQQPHGAGVAHPYPPAETVRFDTDVGPLLLPAHDDVMSNALRALATWEPEEGAFLREHVRPGMTAMDVGAHCGYHALLLCSLVGAEGHVVAVEADPHNAALLQRNLDAGGASNWRAVHAAASSRSGTALLSLSDEHNTGDQRSYLRASRQAVLAVPALALDDLDPPLERLDVVVLDVQGSERGVVDGMRATIERFRPTMIVEFWPDAVRDLGDDPAVLISVYRELGYDVRVLDAAEIAGGAEPQRFVTYAQGHHGGYCTLVLDPAVSG